jgi:hypothetical protein
VSHGIITISTFDFVNCLIQPFLFLFFGVYKQLFLAGIFADKAGGLEAEQPQLTSGFSPPFLKNIFARLPQSLCDIGSFT